MFLFQEQMTRKRTPGMIASRPVHAVFLIFQHQLGYSKRRVLNSSLNTISFNPCMCLLIFQTAYIPEELYKRVYNFCKRLMTYPHPYCTVGLSYTRQIKTECSVPGIDSRK